MMFRATLTLIFLVVGAWSLRASRKQSVTSDLVKQLEDVDEEEPCNCSKETCCRDEGNRGYKIKTCAKTGKYKHCEAIADELGISYKPPPKPESGVLRFLRGLASIDSGSLYDFRKKSDKELQFSRTQWIYLFFPIDRATHTLPWAKLEPEDINKIKKDEFLQKEILANFERFLEFIGLKLEQQEGQKPVVKEGPNLDKRQDELWDAPYSMVDMAIAHAEKCLRLTGFDEIADAFKAKIDEIDWDFDY